MYLVDSKIIADAITKASTPLWLTVLLALVPVGISIFVLCRQNKIMEQQNDISMLQYRLKVYITINKVLLFLVEDRFKENFILSSFDNSFYIKKLDEYTKLRDNFLEESYNSSVVFDTKISAQLIDASKKFSLLIIKNLEAIFTMQIEFHSKSLEQQAEILRLKQEYILNKELEMEKLPSELKSLVHLKEIETLSDEVYTLLSNEDLQSKINFYIDNVK